jgi:aryl-alcohol dehydrogenase-like predicted oxidoreductase
MGSWSGSDDDASLEALQRAVERGCNFFDTALAYGDGRSETLLAKLLRSNAEKRLYAATKVPPKNREWPARTDATLDETFPPDHIRACTEQSLRNLDVETIDLLQFHVWQDAWADDARWQNEVDALKREGLIRAIGVSINRWEPSNALRTVRTGVVDAVQVIYNIFDQAPEDELLPLCEELDIGVIARVPFDEGSLTGTLTKQSTWPEGDWRNTYFARENLDASVDRAEALEDFVPDGMSLPELALRFILSHAAVSTTIPGMRKLHHVEQNMATADGARLSDDTIRALRAHRWDRRPTRWSA